MLLGPFKGQGTESGYGGGGGGRMLNIQFFKVCLIRLLFRRVNSRC